MPRTVIVTDSTACISDEQAHERGIEVVPLQVVIGAQAHDEGRDGATPELVAKALADFVPVSTSRPNPAAMREVYERLARDGADEIISIHISGEMSGTVESAQLAAAQVDVPVTCIDSRQVGAATGYAALSAADVLDAGGSATEAAQAARDRAAASTSLFYVDTLEYLRRGGRIGAAAAILGGALSVKPLLTIADGKVANLEKVRTGAKALARLEDLAVEAAGESEVDAYVAHLANHERAEQLTAKLAERLGDNLGDREIWCGQLGAVLGAHVGPGMVAVCVAPRLPDQPTGAQ